MPDRRWRTWLSETARRDLVEAATAAHPNETGGVLIGVIADGRPWITAAREVRPAAATGTYYRAAPGAARAVVKAVARDDRRVGYLGEWHSHPADIGHSALDAATMRSIATDPSAGCAWPVLLIARRRGGAYAIDALQADRGRLRPLRVIGAGDLPPHPVPVRTFRPTRKRRLRSS